MSQSSENTSTLSKICVMVGIENKDERTGGVMVIMLSYSAVDRGFESRSVQTKDYVIGICCFSVKHTTLRSKSKGWLALNQDNVSEESNMSTYGLLFQ
jgi:hypothetical protein